MLVLTRKRNQEIMLGDDIKITVLEISEDAVKIGIDAPRDITILRSELYRAVQDENKSAVFSDPNSVKLLFKKLQ